ncbi:oligosaccharide flippase family protein [Enterococcus casseliflavus]|uniref:oligosaccharide flippase family protein n=1 Tax=Enterococcus casseliflavus TaxID=37734 RepID=UPI002DBFFC76|nr:oligosaccharide flippase family protein [Enterococcus casseliflavus]MEB8398462.1 oligosaccharide flippase family protein [Enterococcus casseliflavus]
MIKNIINTLKKDKFIKSVSVLATGSILSQVITILVSPFTTRFFSPSDFGYYTLFTTVVSIFGPILCLKYDMAIVNSKYINKMNLLVLGSGITIIISFFASFFYGKIVFKQNFNIFVFLVLLLLLMSYGANNLLIALNNSNSEYKLLSKVTIIKSSVQAVLTIIFGLFNLTKFGLIFAQLISQVSGSWKQSESIRNKQNLAKVISRKKILEVFKLNYKQALYNTPAALITTLTYSVINLFISYSYSNEMLGFYSFSYRMLGLPFMIVSANFAKIFFKEASDEYLISGTLSTTFKRSVKILCAIVLPSMTILFILAPSLFSIIFGQEWGVSGTIVQILTPMFTIRLIVDSISSAYIVRGKQKTELWIQCFLFISELVIFFVSTINNFNIYYFLGAISLMYFFVYAINFYVIFRLSCRGDNS